MDTITSKQGNERIMYNHSTRIGKRQTIAHIEEMIMVV